MIASINGLINTSIQDNTTQKENAKMSKEQEKALIDKLMHKPLVEVLPKFIDIDESKDNWITDTINKIDTMLSKKYDFTIEQRRALIAKYPENMEELEISVLQGHMDWLLTYSVDGKPTISGKMVGLGAKEEEMELENFMRSLPDDSMSSKKAQLYLAEQI